MQSSASLHRAARLALRSLLVLIVAAPAIQGQSSGRPFSIDDVLRMHRLGPVRPSPDGELFVVSVTRPASAGDAFLRQANTLDRTDLWLVSKKDGTLRKLTDGLKSQTGYSSASWSPDGARLAYYTLTGDGPVTLGVWDRKTGTLKRVSDRSIDPFVRVGGSGPASPISWLSNRTVLVGLYPPGGTGIERGQLAMVDRAVGGWRKTEKGVEPAISVLTSGAVKGDTVRTPRTLGVVDVLTGSVTPIVDGEIRSYVLSPARTHFAFTVDAGMRKPKAGQPFGFGSMRHWKLGVTSVAATRQVRWIRGAFTANTPTPLWSPDGARLALIGNVQDVGSDTIALVVEPGSESARSVLPAGWKAERVAWTTAGTLLVRALAPGAGSARDTTTDSAAKRGPRADWYLARDNAAPLNLTSSMKIVPGELVRGPGTLMVGVVADTLWGIDAAAAAVTALSRGVAKVSSIVWPTYDPEDGVVVVEAGESDARTLHRFDLRTAGSTPVTRPSLFASLQVFEPRSGESVFTGATPDGTFLWLGSPGREFRTPISLNQFIREVATGKRMLINYRGVEGDSLGALVVLPLGYQEGKRYPTVAWVYAGTARRDTMYILLDKHEAHSLNLQVLPANGYVVVIPSMPLAPDGVASDPYIDLPKGVIGAIDKLIEMGITDPKKLAVMGQSYGGYSTMSLITYTNRFQAAVELAGPPDLISFYTVFEPTERYNPDASESMFAPRWSETGQGRMGRPPWDDLWRYLRNSPLYYVERVNTPLLLIQGDFDFVSMIGGEQFFTALHRLGKPARFVRFWGEGHVLNSPANVRHQWKEIIDWFDTYLKRGGK